MASQEDYQLIINHFLDKSEFRVLTICLLSGSTLIPANHFPDNLKNKAIYFVKR